MDRCSRGRGATRREQGARPSGARRGLRETRWARTRCRRGQRLRFGRRPCARIIAAAAGWGAPPRRCCQATGVRDARASKQAGPWGQRIDRIDWQSKSRERLEDHRREAHVTRCEKGRAALRCRDEPTRHPRWHGSTPVTGTPMIRRTPARKHWRELLGRRLGVEVVGALGQWEVGGLIHGGQRGCSPAVASMQWILRLRCRLSRVGIAGRSPPRSTARSVKVDAFEDQRQLRRLEIEVGGAGRDLPRQAEAAALDALRDQHKSSAIPEEYFDLMSALADEAEDVSRERLKCHVGEHGPGQRVDASTSIDGRGGEVDSNRRR